MQRRTLLLQLLGVGASATAGPALALMARPGVSGASGPASAASPAATPAAASAVATAALPFRPLIGPLPLAADGLSAAEQQRTYSRVALRDALLVPEGYRVELLLQWGDRLGSGRFGFNHDYLAFTALEGNRSLLTVNFEYISPRPWV
ncbi:MAG: alkaline phosphatase PhoX, partial [Cyanobium sp.]